MMKLINLLPLAVVLILFSCIKNHCEDGKLNKDETEIDCGGQCDLCPIEYPETSPYGANLLDKDMLSYSANASFQYDIKVGVRAFLPAGTSLVVHVYKTTSGSPGSFGVNSSSYTGWTAGDYTGGRWFTSVTEGFIDMALHFEGSQEWHVDYFENGVSTSATPTFSKIINAVE